MSYGSWDSDPGGEAEDMRGLLQDVLVGLQRLGQKKRRQQQQQQQQQGARELNAY